MISYDLIKDVFDLDNPLTLEYFELCSVAYDGKGEKHHILPKSLFPEFAKSKWNIVSLDYGNHYSVHEILPQICLQTSHKSSMLMAWNVMCHKGGARDYVSKEMYSELRTSFVASISGTNSRLYGQPMLDTTKEILRKRILECGGTMLGKSHTKESKDKMSESRRGEKNAMYGRHHTEETKAKLRYILSGEKSKLYGIGGEGHHRYGVKLSEETKSRMSESHTGVPLSEQHKKAIGLGNTGRVLSEDSKLKISLANTGKRHSPESLERMSIIKTGKVQTEETKAKISANHLGKSPTIESVVFKGRTFLTKKAIVDEFGLDYNKIKKLVSSGEIVVTPKRKQ